MELLVFIVLFVFMALFIGGGGLLIRGALTKNRKQFIWGLLMLLSCIPFMWLVKNLNLGGLY